MGVSYVSDVRGIIVAVTLAGRSEGCGARLGMTAICGVVDGG